LMLQSVYLFLSQNGTPRMKPKTLKLKCRESYFLWHDEGEIEMEIGEVFWLKAQLKEGDKVVGNGEIEVSKVSTKGVHHMEMKNEGKPSFVTEMTFGGGNGVSNDHEYEAGFNRSKSVAKIPGEKKSRSLRGHAPSVSAATGKKEDSKKESELLRKTDNIDLSALRKDLDAKKMKLLTRQRKLKVIRSRIKMVLQMILER